MKVFYTGFINRKNCVIFNLLICADRNNIVNEDNSVSNENNSANHTNNENENISRERCPKCSLLPKVAPQGSSEEKGE